MHQTLQTKQMTQFVVWECPDQQNKKEFYKKKSLTLKIEKSCSAISIISVYLCIEKKKCHSSA